jgi:hypothetical protein
MHRTGDAGIEAVDGAQDLDGLFGIVQAVALERRLVGPSWPSASRGPAFQVLGTTAW